jgi:hypothetical protein
VRDLPRSAREALVRSKVGAKHGAPLLAAVKADRSRHRRLIDDYGEPAFLRAPNYGVIPGNRRRRTADRYAHSRTKRARPQLLDTRQWVNLEWPAATWCMQIATATRLSEPQ